MDSNVSNQSHIMFTPAYEKNCLYGYSTPLCLEPNPPHLPPPLATAVTPVHEASSSHSSESNSYEPIVQIVEENHGNTSYALKKQKRRGNLPLEVKYKIIEDVDKGVPYAELLVKYDLRSLSNIR